MENMYNQLVYFGFLQCLFLLGIYAFSIKARKNINPYLLVLLIVLLMGLSGRVIYALGYFGKNYKLISLSEYATYLFGVTVYLFTRSCINHQKFKKHDLLHYVPGLIYAIVLSAYYTFVPSDIISQRYQNGQLFLFVSFAMGTALIINISYWILSLRLVKQYADKALNELSFSVKLNFLKKFLIGIGLSLLGWLIIYIVGIVEQSWLERNLRPFLWMSLAYLILFLSYYNIKDPAIFRLSKLEKRSKKYQKSRLSLSEVKILRDKLDQVMIEKKPYLNRRLMKNDLADLLGVNSPDVARILNESIGMNFFEYVNYYRIKEFVELAQTDKAKTLTFFALAQEAGFNSKTTFNNSFKKIMGTSPRKYFAQNDLDSFEPW